MGKAGTKPPTANTHAEYYWYHWRVDGPEVSGGRRVFSLLELAAVRSRRDAAACRGRGAVGRVSSRRQRAEGDLDRQLARLRQAARGRIVVAGLWDVSSGLSDQRRGLRRALEACQRR
jgi:hypothetical protein